MAMTMILEKGTAMPRQPHNIGTWAGRKTRLARLLAIGLATALPFGLASCSQGPGFDQPVMYDNLNRTGASVNPQEALSMLNAYRSRQGLSQLVLSDKLTTAAQEQANAMAAADKVSHTLGRDRTLIKRLNKASYEPDIAVENISAGYWTLAEAFSGWRDSRGHNANMLRKGVTEMGIATSYRPDAKYKVFWTLILAKPSEIKEPDTMSQMRPNILFAQ
ncbi:CAP domain-containing protein [Cohaesibacter intestini]|uniref:CAP domain-containing protein n=1 Tax=Cohaesibacter intestini TaxID=2211145 RepID=UPI000DE82250|nr:CAP domain-containing protein [Cohaesibacter intestini]